MLEAQRTQNSYADCGHSTQRHPIIESFLPDINNSEPSERWMNGNNIVECYRYGFPLSERRVHVPRLLLEVNNALNVIDTSLSEDPTQYKDLGSFPAQSIVNRWKSNFGLAGCIFLTAFIADDYYDWEKMVNYAINSCENGESIVLGNVRMCVNYIHGLYGRRPSAISRFSLEIEDRLRDVAAFVVDRTHGEGPRNRFLERIFVEGEVSVKEIEILNILSQEGENITCYPSKIVFGADFTPFKSK
ncbi:hypothetical protein KC675_00790 [Candidatus Dojkabacteria bacterium]|uniref:Uncharacterized protein n=1 Tax=Candidatus Dojkabacteria bacterium TaxID=2099670 RepID=A0A955I858_9BACT|nr:hypothetical protein [Candidatus Dojkabacteria bacterium]